MSSWRVCSIAIVEGEGRSLIVGRESGLLEKYGVGDLCSTLLSIQAHERAVTAVAPSGTPDEVYTACSDGTVHLWTLATEVEGKRLVKSFQAAGGVRCLSIAGEAVYAGCESGEIAVLAPDAAVWKGHQDAVVGLDVSDSFVCSASFDNQLRVWDLGGRCLYVLLGHTNHVKGCMISSNFVVSCSRDETIKVWTLAGETEGGADAVGDAAAGDAGEGSHGGGEEPVAAAPRVIHPSGTVELPECPSCVTPVANRALFIGCCSGSLFAVNTKQLVTAVSSFEAATLRQYRRQLAASQRKTRTFVTMEKKKLKSATLGKTKELKKLQREQGEATRRAMKRSEEEQPRGDEGDEANEEVEEELPEEAEQDAEVEGHGADEMELQQELQAELETFTAAVTAKFQGRVGEAQRLAEEYQQALAPLLNHKFVVDKGRFRRALFSHEFQRGDDVAFALVVDGSNLFVAESNGVRRCSAKAGLTVL